MNSFLTILREHEHVIRQLEGVAENVDQVVKQICLTIMARGKVLLMGNGGSAADAQHIAAEFVGRFQAERPALPAIALTTDTSILTAVGNDYGFDHIFARQIEALCQPCDLVIGFSTSGNSINILNGVKAAKRLGAYTVGLTGGNGGKLRALADLCICVPSTVVARIQEAHVILGHSLCELVETRLTQPTLSLTTAD